MWVRVVRLGESEELWMSGLGVCAVDGAEGECWRGGEACCEEEERKRRGDSLGGVCSSIGAV